MPRCVDYHPVSGIPLHVDFLRVNEDSEVNVTVPIEFINEDKSPGIKKGGILNVVVRNIECRCLLKNIPSKFVLDLSEKEIGDGFFVDDLELHESVVVVSKRSVIATLVGTKDSDSSSSEQSGGGKSK
jgi:large subunit ribosomal protein L25